MNSENPTAMQTTDPRHRILIVDDNPAIHDDFRKILGGTSVADEFDEEAAAFFGTEAPLVDKVDFDLDFASQGLDALERVRVATESGRRYAVVFMDVRMPPGIDGVETTGRLWEVDPDLQVVICTAFSDHSWEDMVRRLGRTDRLLILKKPFDMIEVLQCAHALTGKWALLQEARHHAESLESAVRIRTGELVATNARLEVEISERRRSDEALRFTQFSVDNASDALFRVGADSRLLYANAATCRTLGYKGPELRGMSVLDIVPELGEGGWDSFWQSLRSGHHRTFEAEFAAKDGTLIPIELTVSFFHFDDQELLCASARDITVRRRILAELSTARDVAFESVRSKGRFLANMSHEIRTPMNGVIGMAELLLHTNLSIDQREYVDTIRHSADLLLNIINDILDSSKIESESPNFETADFDLGTVIDGTLDIVGGLARKKRLELASYTGHDVFPYLRGDSGRLRQVLTNLLGNAIKFTHEGEVVLTVSRIAETDTHTELLFEVKDTGIGIARDVSPRIFEPFVQADGSAARQYGGTGLGLSICRQIVEALGGKIGVESTPGEGSRFWFTITFEKQAEPTLAAAAIRDVPAGLRVLVVDDNATNRRILQLQLANLSLRSSGVGGGDEALQLLLGARAGEDAYDIAILDMQMPDMDGLTLARRIKADPMVHRTRLILISSLGEQPAEGALTAAGVEGHLLKPLKQSRLQAALAAVTSSSPLPPPSAEDAPSSSVPPAPVRPRATDPAPAKRAPRHALRILVAEDNVVNQKVILLQLQHLGYAADLADDGNAALGLLEKTPYDLIFMDCQMPVMDGYTATREIRRKYTRPVRIIAMTANAMQGDREKCLRSGMDDFLSKPISPPELVRVLEQCTIIPDEGDAGAAPSSPAAAGGSTESVVESAGPAPDAFPAPEDPAALPPKSAPPVEIARLLDITGHDDGMLRQISRDYLLQAEEILSHIYLAIERRDPAELRRLAHKLCGSSSTCGMNAIVAPLERLERMGDVPHFAIAAGLHQDAVHQLSRIRRFLTAHLAASGAATQTPANPS